MYGFLSTILARQADISKDTINYVLNAVRNDNMTGRNIAIIRKKRGFTQKELAKFAGISEDYLSMIERGKRVPARKTLARIANILEADLRDLVN